MTGDKQHDATSELNEALAAGFAANNFEALGPFYTEDAQLLPPRGQAREGRAAAAAFWGTVASRFSAVSFTTAALKDLGEQARRETGSFTMKGEGQTVEGKYVFVWQLVDGEWQIESAIWNREGGGARAAGQGQRRAGGGQGGGPRDAGGGPRGPGGGYRAGRPSFQAGLGGGRGPGGGRRGGAGGAQGGEAGGALYDGNAGLYSDPKG